VNQLALLDNAGRPTLTAARLERDEGMERALAHAERIVDGWSRVAWRFLVLYAGAHQRFIAQDVVRAFKDEGYTAPPSDKAFGQIFLTASKIGVIAKAGYAPAPHRHASPAVLWESKVWRAA
jgi:hypothetical protein